MAMMDNAAFLLTQLRHGFITSDDTGICEIILEGEEIHDKAQVGMLGSEKRPKTLPANLNDSNIDTDTELAHSIDIVPDMDFASHRRRSNTAQRLEKLKREKHKQSKIRHVQWKEVEYQPEICASHFEKVAVEKKTEKPKKSKLSLQLENFDTTSCNAFNEYAKFDGKSSVGLPAKKIEIFLMMAPPEDRSYPMTVVTLASAKVQELIGLICWQYSMEGRQPSLEENVEAYALHMAEDDGDVDMEFPALDPREPMSKFGFAKLALVSKPQAVRKEPHTTPAIDVTIHHVGGFSTLTVENESLSMKNIVDMVLEKRKIRQRRGLEYRLEKKSSPGSSMDLQSSLGTTHAREFVLVRENSIRDDLDVVDVPHNQMAESLSSHQYKSFVVKLSRKLPIKQDQDVQIGIAGEKIEIDPIGANKTVLFKQKAVTYVMEDIAACLLLEEKSSGKGVFRLVYQRGHDFKHHDFECSLPVAKEIVTKVNNILDMRSSPVRKDYKVHREKKMNKRHTTLGF